MLWCCRASAATSASPALINSVQAQSDHFGPMLIQFNKTALYISISQPPLDCAFIDSLKSNGWQVATATPILAASAFEQHKPLLVLIDNRLPDLLALSKTLHCLQGADDVLFAAISDRIVSDKRRRSLSQADLYHVVLSSSTDVALCEFFARITSRLRAIPALFAVLEEAEQPIEICDETRSIQYVNRAYESLTGCIRNEVLGTKSSDARRKSLHSCVPRPKESDAEAMIRRASTEWHCIQVPGSSFGTQYVYVKRGSTDAVMCRDISLKSVRSQSALVDAPITEVLITLREAMQRSDEETQQLLKEAIRALSSAELYAPSITRFSNTDRIATGYYDGLIRLHHPSRQRKRSVVDAFKEKRNVSGDARRRVSADVKNALSNDREWGFDILRLERVTENHALLQLGIKIFERWKVQDTLKCSSALIAQWFTVIENHYHSLNPYHNATHAADVLQATSYFLDSPAVAHHVQDTHATAALIAAAVHDLDHPGRGNAFLINTRQSLALLYNDQSVLENHHVALAFQLTLQQSNNVNIFAKLNRDEFVAIRQAVVEMVLSTDMCRHFEYLTKFQQTIGNLHECDEERDTTSMTVCRMLIKCADIGNPTREWSLCKQWAMRIVEEYFDQTSEEREKGLPLTMELFDRNTCNVPLTQCGFIDMFARETFTSWSEFAELPELLKQLEINYENWRQQTTSWNPAQNVNLIVDT